MHFQQEAFSYCQWPFSTEQASVGWQDRPRSACIPCSMTHKTPAPGTPLRAGPAHWPARRTERCRATCRAAGNLVMYCSPCGPLANASWPYEPVTHICRCFGRPKSLFHWRIYPLHSRPLLPSMHQMPGHLVAQSSLLFMSKRQLHAPALVCETTLHTSAHCPAQHSAILLPTHRCTAMLAGHSLCPRQRSSLLYFFINAAPYIKLAQQGAEARGAKVTRI